MKLDRTILKYLGYNATGDLGPWTFYTSKRKGLVFFVKAPPLEPPTLRQSHQRNKFRIVGMLWRSLHPSLREAWTATQDRANLNITGYNLFTYYILKHDRAAIETIEHQTGLTLLPLNSVN